MSKTAETKMSKAKAMLVLEQPFFAALMCNLPFIMDDTLNPPTMATDGEHVYWHPQWVEDHTVDEVKFVVCHEILHCVFQHMFRRNGRDARKWNVAADFVINKLLVEDRVGTMPAGALRNDQLVAAGGGTSEGVYDLLPQDPGKGGGSGSGNGPPQFDECRDAQGTQAEKQHKADIMKVRIAQAAQAAKMCGKMSGGLSRLVGEVLNPQVDWRDVLRRFVSSKAKVEYTFARPKRRFATEDFMLPSLGGEMLGELVVAVDCSGSIGARELSEFAAEIKAIHEDCRPVKLHVMYFDSAVSHIETYEPGDELDIRAHGGGGTAFSPIFQKIVSETIDAVGVVVLTDLYCSDFGTPPSCPVLWVTTGAESAPWGEVVKMRRS